MRVLLGQVNTVAIELAQCHPPEAVTGFDPFRFHVDSVVGIDAEDVTIVGRVMKRAKRQAVPH